MVGPSNPVVHVISMEESPSDLSQLIDPTGTLFRVRLIKDRTPLVALINYSPLNALVIAGHVGQASNFGPNYGSFTMSSASQLAMKPTLIIGGGGAEQILEIGGITKTRRVYQLKELAEAEEKEKKRKGKEALAEEPQRKKRVDEDDTTAFIKTLKRSKYPVVEQLKKQPAQISILFLLLLSEAHRPVGKYLK